jgi:hypothetical protein
MPMLRVKDWDTWFENNKSRTYKNKSQVCMPNKQGLGYRRLLRMPNGEAMFGAWCAMIEALSRQQNRAGWLTENGKKDSRPLGSGEIAELTLFSEATCSQMLDACAQETIGWLIVTADKDTTRTPDGQQTDTTVPLQGDCRAVDRIGLDRTGQEGEPRARGENLGSGEPGTVVARCRKMYADLRELGPDWERLTFEHLVELVKGHPRADLDRVRARIWADWKGQALPAIKTPPMIVRQCLEWDEADGGRGNARKSAAPRGGVPSPEELRMRRMGGAS